MQFDRIHAPTGAIEDGFYAVPEDARFTGDVGYFVFRVKTNPTTAKHRPGRQVLAIAKNPYARVFRELAILTPEGGIVPLWRYKDAGMDAAVMAALRRLRTPDTREDAGQMYARVFGRCRICNRKLTHPDSVATGIGPECAGTRQHVEL